MASRRIESNPQERTWPILANQRLVAVEELGVFWSANAILQDLRGFPLNGRYVAQGVTWSKSDPEGRLARLSYSPESVATKTNK